MKSILFCTFVFEKGGSSHLNTELIKLLTNEFNVTVLSNKEFLTDDITPAVLIENKTYKIQSGIRNIIGIFHNMLIAAKYAKKLEPDLVFVSVYETRSFAIARPLFGRRCNIVVLENNNIDHLDSKFNRMMYRTFAKKINHFVFEEFIARHIIEAYEIPNDKVYVLPHVLYEKEEIGKKDMFNDIDYQCIAISTSNDEELVKNIIKVEEEYSILKNNSIKMFIKSKKVEYSNGALVVKPGHIPDDKYDALFANCKVVYIPFSNEYSYRMSGNIIDSFSAHKRVIATRFMLSEQYEHQYPELISVVDDGVMALKKIVEACQDASIVDFSQFEYNHSNSRILGAFKNVIDN